MDWNERSQPVVDFLIAVAGGTLQELSDEYLALTASVLDAQARHDYKLLQEHLDDVKVLIEILSNRLKDD